MKPRWWVVIGLLLLLLGGKPQAVNASTATFMIRPELPQDNRVGQQAGYFDLTVGKTRRTIALRVFNPQPTKQKIRLRLLQATTMVNGKLKYQPAPATLKRHFDYASTKILAPRTQAQVTVTLPNRATIGTGTKLLALELTTLNASSQNTVNNRVRYRIGLVLQGQSRTRGKLLHLASVGGKIALQKPTLHLTLTANDGRFRSDLTVKTRLNHANQPWLNYQVTQKHLRWAPDTDLPLAIHLAGKQLHAGIYRVVMQIKVGTDQQTLTRYLAITHDGQVSWTTARRFAMAQRWWWGVIAALVGSVAIIGFFRQRRKRHAQTDC